MAGTERDVEPLPRKERRVLRPKALGALGVGTALAVALAWAARPLLRERPPVAHDRPAIEALLRERAGEGPAPPAAAPPGSRRPEDRRWYLPREDAQTLFAIHSSGQRYDPWCYYSHIPGLSREIEWPDHPLGSWTYRTNSLGLREDLEVLSARPDVRVLVIGDSHTEGFCDNADSFPNLVEASLARRFPERSVEVLNAADGGYSFHNYLGVLEKHLDLAPDVVVLAVYGGNDYLEVLLPHRYFAREPLPPTDEEERSLLGRSSERFGPEATQAFLSLLRFVRHPEEAEVAIRAAVELVREMGRVAGERSIAMLCLHLPSSAEADWPHRSERYEAAAAELGLERGDFAVQAEIGRRFLREIAALGIATLDLGPTLARRGGPCFWASDQHLNLDGHAAVAVVLEPVLARLAGLEP